MTTETLTDTPTPEDAPAGDTPLTATDATADTAAAPSEDAAILAALRGEEADPAKEGVEPALDTPTGEAKPAATEATAAEPTKTAEDAKASVLDEETPKDYKGRTRENFERLRAEGIAHRTRAQELEQQLTQLAPNLEREANFTQLLADSGGTPEDIGTSISLIRAVNKGTPEEKRGALQIAQAVMQILADQLGEALPGVDYLQGHADLAQRVAEGDLSDADAREIAVLRRSRTVQSETAAQQAARERQAASHAAATRDEEAQRQSAARDVEAMATQYRARDGEEAYKVRITYAQQQFSRISAHATVAPAKIAATFKDLYESPEAQMLVDASRVRAQPVGVRPVMGASGRGAAGTAQPMAQSEEDAVRLALRGG